MDLYTIYLYIYVIGVDGCVDKCMDGWTDRGIDGWMYGRMDKWTRVCVSFM